MALTTDRNGRPNAQSGRSGPGSCRDRPVSLEIFTGELGCGDLIYELKLQFDRADPGAKVRVVTADPGAPKDIPEWCRMTGHVLLERDAPFYVIQVRNRTKGEK